MNDVIACSVGAPAEPDGPALEEPLELADALAGELGDVRPDAAPELPSPPPSCTPMTKAITIATTTATVATTTRGHGLRDGPGSTSVAGAVAAVGGGCLPTVVAGGSTRVAPSS